MTTDAATDARTIRLPAELRPEQTAPAVISRPPDPGRQQRLFIGEARRLLKPTPVGPPSMPRWLRLRMLAALRGKRRQHSSTAGWSLLEDVREILGHALDHFGTTEFRGRKAFVVEPYSLDLADVQACQRFADLVGCEWQISSNSWWYPGRTIRVVFFERDEAAGTTA